MMKHLLVAASGVALLSGSALAADDAAPKTPSPVVEPAVPSPQGAVPANPSGPPETTGAITPANADIVLSDAQAKAWVDKSVYSSDAKSIGEVAAIARDSSGKVTELHADIGGFLGLGETRVKVLPSQFKLAQDRVVLNISSEDAKKLPHLPK